MFYIRMINNKNETFTKYYESYYLYYKDLTKFKHARNIKIISFGGK